jgi:uncharacterized phiE125 gp8 family phage protein
MSEIYGFERNSPDWINDFISGPDSEPVTLAECKAHMKIDINVEDDLIEALIPAARQAIESEIQRPLGVQLFEIGLEYFPFFLQFPKAPFAELVSAKYIDSDGAEHTVFDLETSPPTTSGIYILDELKGILNVKVGEHWPLTILNYGYPVHIRYKAGFDPLPAALKQAMLRMVAHLYANREAVIQGQSMPLPLGVEYLCNLHREVRFR